MIKETKINLHFDPELHRYSNADTGEVFTSVTTVIGEYKGKFNSRYWSMYTALKNIGTRVRHEQTEKYITVNFVKHHIDDLWANRTYERLANKTLDKWGHLTDVANARGNKIHDYLEDSINESKDDVDGISNNIIKPIGTTGYDTKEEALVIIRTKHDLDKTDLGQTYPEIYDRLLHFINLGATIFAEKRVYTSHYGVAGMIDVLIVLGKRFWILDWKTNKDEMMFRSGYFKKVKDKDGKWVRSKQYIEKDIRLKDPIGNLQECKGIIYSLQLSLYSYIMELWGYEPAENHLEIFHIRPNRKPELLKIRYYREEVKRMLEHFKGQGLKTVDQVKEEKNKFNFGLT